MIKARGFLIIFSVIGLVLPILALHFVQPLSGDLTRIGLLPERAFGWNTAQPTLTGRTATVDKLGDAEILIVGDSFSNGGTWQAYAFSAERKYMTLRLGRICDDFPEFIAALGKPPKILIIEVIERDSRNILAVNCVKSSLQALDGKHELRNVRQGDVLGGVFAPKIGGGPELRSDRQLSIFGGVFGYKYIFGSALYYLFPGNQHRPGTYGGVRVQNVDGGCAFFSHRECELGLFVGDDFTLGRLGGDDLQSTKLTVVTRLFERVLVVVVPNKSSVYLESRDQAQRKDESLRLFGQNLGVDVVPLHVAFYEAKSRIKDLYLPDDTHLSTAGFRELAVHLATHDSLVTHSQLPSRADK